MSISEKREELKKLSPPGNEIDNWTDEMVNGRFAMLEGRNVAEIAAKRGSNVIGNADDIYF